MNTKEAENMRKVIGMTLVLMLLAAGSVSSAETVRLPESRYAVILPDAMTYDGPTADTAEAFAYISEEMLLTVHFFRYDMSMTDVILDLLGRGGDDIRPVSVNGVDMIAFRYPPEEDGWQAVGYILEDGNAALEILFWYGTQEAADLTKTIMESIEETETV